MAKTEHRPVRAWAARWFLAVFCGLPSAVLGHDPGLSTATLRLESDKLEAVLVFSVVDVGELVDLHRDGKGQIAKEQLAKAAAELSAKAAQSLEVEFDEQPVQTTVARCRFEETDNASIYLSFPARPFAKLVVRSKWLAMARWEQRQPF